MELTTINADQASAEAAFKEYRGAFLAHRNVVDGELMRGYRALKEGKQLIRLSETIAAGGVDELGRPRLAIARADERGVRFEKARNGAVMFTSAGRWERQHRAPDRRFSLPAGTLPETADWPADLETGHDWWADMPIVPPRFRPPNASSMRGFHVLWEAEWRRVSRQRRAPRDPALLKRIGGDLFAVLAVWDLTELERAVLEMRGS